MAFKRGLLVYIKILLLITLVSVFYWRDFIAIWQKTTSTPWIIVTSAIVSLASIFVFQRRRPLKILLLISENNNSQGAALMLLAFVLYIVGSYTTHALWLHLCSLILFLTGYLFLIIDFRIPRMLFLPLTTLLFVVPPLGINVSEVQDLPTLFALYLSADAVIVTLVAYIMKASKWWKWRASSFIKRSPIPKNEVENGYCPLCQSDGFKEEVFCFHCGRQRVQPKLKPFKFALGKFLVLFLIVLALSIVYVPTFSLAQGEASLISYTPHGIEKQSIIPTPDGWKLESSERLFDYERERSEDFVVVATYGSGESFQKKSQIQLEIGSRMPYIMNEWKLPGWKRLRQDVFLTNVIKAQSIRLLKENTTITVLFWTMKLMFKVDSVFSVKNVGVSVLSTFTEQMTEPELEEILAEFRHVSAQIINWWNFVRSWTFHFFNINLIYNLFGDIFLMVVGVVVVLAFAAWVRAKDEKDDKFVENAFLLMEDEETLLVAVSRMKPRGFFGKEVFEAYERIARSETDLEGFYEKLRKFSISGLVKKDFVRKNEELVMVWRRMFI